MRVVRSVLWWVLIGALVGTWAGGLVARSFVPWFNTPGAGIMSQCACEPLAISSVSHTLQFELGGMFSGAVLALALGLVLGAGRPRPAEPPKPATPPAAPA
jgi:hypothetical protein